MKSPFPLVKPYLRKKIINIYSLHLDLSPTLHKQVKLQTSTSQNITSGGSAYQVKTFDILFFELDSLYKFQLFMHTYNAL